jgi:hypothetical protein
MLKIITGIFLSIRNLFQSLLGSAFKKAQDDKTGKMKGVNPKNVPAIIFASGLVFFAIVMFTQLMARERWFSGGADEFKKEMTPRVGVTDQAPDALTGEDPLSEALKAGAKNTANAEALKEGLGTRTDGPLTQSDCQALMKRATGGEDLMGADKDKLNTCIDKNIGGWTPDQIEMAKALVNDADLTFPEKELLRRAIEGKVTADEMVLAKAMVSPDQNIREMARMAVRDGDPLTMQALAASLQGKPLTAEQKAALERLATKVAAEKGLNVNDLLKSVSGKPMALDGAPVGVTVGGGAGGVDAAGSNGALVAAGPGEFSPKALEALAKEVATKAEEIRILEKDAAVAQAAAAEAGEKIKTGQVLTEQDQTALRKLTDIQKTIKEKKVQYKKLQTKLAEATTTMQKAISQVSVSLEQNLPTDFNVEYEDGPASKKKQSKPEPVAVILGKNGKPLSPDKVRLIAIRRKELFDLEKKNKADNFNMNNPASGFMNGSESMDVRGVMTNQTVEVNKLFVFQEKTLKPFLLTPDMRVPAQLMSMILVSSKGRPQQVRYKVLANVHAPDTGEIVIPKGAIIIGQTSSFDNDTGIMDMSTDKVSVGSGKVLAVKFSVGSADGTSGLKGEIHDTRGKFLAGAFISAFSAGALAWFSQSVVQPYQTQTDVGSAMLGASAAGGAEVAQKIADLFSADLQNAPYIYYCPKGVYVILYPNE